MNPSECKRIIQKEYKARALKGEINYSAIEGIIEQRCREAAAHGGIWKEYLPEGLRR